VPQTPAEQPKTASAPKQEREQDGPLPEGAVARLGTLRFRHADSVTCIAIGTDGTSILSAAGNTVYVWDLATGKERQRFPKHATMVTSFVCSRDGKLLASGCRDGTIHVWDMATGRERLHFAAYKVKAPDGASSLDVFVAGFTPNGRQIISTGSDNTIQLWDVTSGENIREFGRFSSVTRVSLSPDGKTIAGEVKNDMTWELRLWEVATGRERKQRLQPGKRFLSPAFSPDGKMLVVSIGEEDWKKPCDIQLWDVEAAKEIRTLRGHKGWAWCTFSPDGKILASSSIIDNTARLWDVNTGKEIGRIGADKPANFNQLLFCLDGRTLVSYTQVNHTFRFWDRASGKEVRSSGDAISPIEFINFSPDGRLLAAGSKEHWDIRLWDVAMRKTIRRLEHDLLSAVQFSPDGSRLATAACTDSQVRIWEVVGGKELRRIPSDKGVNSINRMAWSGDGKVLATWSRKDRLLRLWNLDTGKQLREWSAGIRVESLAFSPDSKILAAFGEEQQLPQFAHILLWAIDTGRPLRSLKVPVEPPYLSSDDTARIAFSPDGRTLVAGTRNAEASIYAWETASGRLRFTLKHGEDVACLAFSPDGKLLAAVNNINVYRHYLEGPESLGLKVLLPRVHLWDLVAEKEIQVLKSDRGAVCTLAFSPDGKLLATGSNDTTVLLWDATRFRTNRPTEVRLSSEQLEAVWTDLAGADAVKAYRAIRTLAAAPKSSVAFLKQHLRPVAPADAKQVARLLAELDSEQFAVRDKAMQQLEKLGDSAATELHNALAAKPTLEVRRRIEQLLEKEKGVEHIRMVRALESLERMGTAEVRDLCAKLADGVPDAPLTQEARGTLRRMTR
jgi:WD40 repeat protein